MNHFSIILLPVMKSGFYTKLVTISSVVRLRRNSKSLSKAKFAPKKVMVTIWWSAAGLIHYSFLNPSESITSEKYAQKIDEMYGELHHLQQALLNRKGPIRLHNNGWLHIAQPTLQKLNELGYKVLPHLTIFTWPLTNHFFKHLNNFLQGKCFHNQQEAENAFQEFVKSWSMDFYATGINKLFLIGTMCWL